MEEAVGIRWHRLITRLAGNGFPEAQVRLEDEGPRLAMVFRALSGDPGLSIKSSTERSINTWRPFSQRLACPSSNPERFSSCHSAVINSFSIIMTCEHSSSLTCRRRTIM